MDVDPSQALEDQKKKHPEHGELIDKLNEYVTTKLYFQLTQALLEYLGKLGASNASELVEFFDSFIKPFEPKFDKVKWVQIMGIICRPQTPDAALKLIEPFEESMGAHRDSSFLWQILKADKLTLAGKHEEAKDLLESLDITITEAYEVDAMIQSEFHKTYAQLWKALARPTSYFQSSILYLKFTPIEAIPAEYRPKLAFEIGVAALISPEEFNFGELLQQDLIVGSLDGSDYAWVKDVLKAFGEAKLELYDAAMAKHRAQIDAVPELKSAENTVLRPKMASLALMDLAFRKPKKQRRLKFAEIAQHCRVAPNEVERLVMKTMCENLITGKIDEVAQLVIVTWVKPRILDTVRIDLMREKMEAWSAQTSMLLDSLEEMTPELLVS